MLVNTEEMKEFAEFWAKVQKSYNYNSSFKMEDVLSEISRLDYWQKNRVVSGLIYSDPTTPSSQGSGAVAATVRTNRNEGFIVVGGLNYALSTPAVDQIQAFPPVLSIGQSAVLCRVAFLKTDNTVAFKALWGTPATTGSQLEPTNSQILATIGVDSTTGTYVRFLKLTLNRTGDTTVTQSQDNTWRDV